MDAVAIVGAGISGLLSAYYAAKRPECSYLKVYEARYSVGRPHCTGLVSAETVSRIPFARRHVLHEYSSVKIVVPELKAEVNIAFEDCGFTRIDRVGLENTLYQELLSLGVDVSLGDPVLAISHHEGKWSVYSKSSTSRYDLLVLASGYNVRLVKSAGLSCKAEKLSGVQVELETGGRQSIVGEDTVLVVLSKQFGGGFAWVVPTGERTLLAGCATAPNVIESVRCLSLLLSAISKVVGGVRLSSKPFGGIVLRGYPIRPYNKRAVGVGDCVSMVKSLSGGGLYAISLASKFVGAFISQKSNLLREVRLLSEELKKQYFLAKAVKTAIRVAEAVGIEGLRLDIWSRGVSYDDHLGILYEVLSNKESLIALVRKKSATLYIDRARTRKKRHIFDTLLL
ncbi:MAG: NAD(P)/FAD-dependent oxidoreductase [Sulfolobales archaeon]